MGYCPRQPTKPMWPLVLSVLIIDRYPDPSINFGSLSFTNPVMGSIVLQEKTFTVKLILDLLFFLGRYTSSPSSLKAQLPSFHPYRTKQTPCFSYGDLDGISTVLMFRTLTLFLQSSPVYPSCKGMGISSYKL